MTDQTWIDLAALIVAVIGIIGTGIWQLSNTKDELKDEMHRESVVTYDKIDDAVRQFGETIVALRERITQVEFYIRDHYVLKETFNATLDRILLEIKNVSEKMETNKISLENKIDHLNRQLWVKEDHPSQP